ATVNLAVTIENTSDASALVFATSTIFALDASGQRTAQPVAQFEGATAEIAAAGQATINGSTTIAHPRLWGPRLTQTPLRYAAVTALTRDPEILDTYETKFGIRDLRFDANQGVFVNGELIVLKGVNQPHDLGALGAAFNVRAAERQLELLHELA